MVSRRAVVIGGGAGALVLGALGYRAWDRGVFHGASGEAYDGWDEWQGSDADGPKRPVRAAILASSPHNTQPWKFDARAEGISVFADHARNLGTFDPFRREMHIGLGAAIENLALAAAALGYAANVYTAVGRVAPEPIPDESPVAGLQLMAAPARRSRLFEAIPKRHTNRGAYLPDRAISGRSVMNTASAEPEVRVAFVGDPAARKELSAVIVEATQRIIADRQMSEDSFKWIRTGRGDVEAHRDGVVIDTSGVSPSTVIFGKLAPDQDRETTDGFWLDMTRETHTATATAYGVLMVRDRMDKTSALQAGRLWQRMHLDFTADGIAAHPLNQPMEMIDRNLMLGRNDVYAGAIAKIVKAEPGWQPMFVFRLGYAERDALRSPRRRFEDVIKA